ncbi:Bug family tripartite tricarboxylate transporter substrate binding protein [Neoroseomonas soli]|uniref:Tripartite tricarboxylate transporter substrate binding protein n=1 Tax=Neoroseomonas soli TaxID=1081025 RepID=A0A9X9WZW7_9PROT|nr:tripartite tricarboxylate transporter substrate binding protein [Neoroseomonas soli]MBR0672696.1 tripartite tricarboxylate transporter substrate binding protein [Neoroseomonas soli]
MTDRHIRRLGVARRLLLGAPLAVLAAPRTLRADNYPTRPIRILVGFPPGNSTDLTARILADELRNQLGQPVIVENRPGANGSLAAAGVAIAEPDGYALLVSNASSITVNPLLYRDARYEPLRDFAPITPVTASPFIVVINPQSERMRGVRSLEDLVAVARRMPGVLNYGSAGIGNLTHLSVELLSAIAGLNMVHVPFRGLASAQASLIAKEIDFIFDTPSVVPLVQAGTLRAIAVTTQQRWRDLPDVPTTREAGFPDISATFWNAVSAPRRTPRAIQERLWNAINAAVAVPRTRQLLLAQGEIDILSAADFSDRIRRETEQNRETIRRGGVQMQ